jgi:hypothetical protein
MPGSKVEDVIKTLAWLCPSTPWEMSVEFQDRTAETDDFGMAMFSPTVFGALVQGPEESPWLKLNVNLTRKVLDCSTHRR